MIELPVDQILEGLEHGDRWKQGSWGDLNGHCLHHGIRQCQPIPGDAYLIEFVADVQGGGTDWNDAEGRTFDDIKQALVEHREIMPEELEAVFGPQWLQIVALVRRCAVLTSDEVERLKDDDRWAFDVAKHTACLLYTSPSPRDRTRSRMPSSA